MTTLSSFNDELDFELGQPCFGALLVETRNSVYRLHHGRISGGILPEAVAYARAYRVGNHLVVRDHQDRLIVETSSVRAVTRDI